MSTRIVLGGGLGGLSAAKYMLGAFPNHNVTILESTNRTGGYIETTHLDDDSIFEQGPHTIRPKGEAGEATLELVKELKLENEIVPIISSHPAAKNRMIYANGKLNMLPNKFSKLFSTQPPFSKPLVMYLMNDAMNKKRGGTSDESIYDFTDRRFGREVADYLISPMICGICAGNAKEISVKFLMNRLFEYEQEHGSVTRGFISNMFRGNRNAKDRSHSKCSLCSRAKRENWSMYSFKGGLETFPKALSNSLVNDGAIINLNTKVQSMQIKPDAVTINTNNGSFLTDHVLSSIPSQNLAALLENDHPTLAGYLRHIPRVSVAVVNLKYNENLIKNKAFGFLTSPTEKLPILGVIYDSCCFPTGEKTMLTVMMGGFWFKQYFGKNPTDDYLFSVARKHVQEILDINEFPTEYKVKVWKDCIPQYVVGHYDNLKLIEAYIKNYKLPLSLCGSSYYGIGINDVILSAKNAVQAMSSR